MEILKDDMLQLNFHTFIGSWAQFEELHGPFINLGAHLPQNIILPINKGCYGIIETSIYDLFVDSVGGWADCILLKIKYQV